MKKKRIPLTFTIIQGPAGPSLYLNGFRIAGEKPWGGGKVLHEWTVEPEELLTALDHSTKFITGGVEQGLKKLQSSAIKLFGKKKSK